MPPESKSFEESSREAEGVGGGLARLFFVQFYPKGS